MGRGRAQGEEKQRGESEEGERGEMGGERGGETREVEDGRDD